MGWKMSVHRICLMGGVEETEFGGGKPGIHEQDSKRDSDGERILRRLLCVMNSLLLWHFLERE